jgi:hypothetical protein
MYVHSDCPLFCTTFEVFHKKGKKYSQQTENSGADNFILQIYLLLGVTILLGLRGSLSFYFAPAHLVQSTCFFAGIYMVLKGYAFPGFSLESIGFFLLFRSVTRKRNTEEVERAMY